MPFGYADRRLLQGIDHKLDQLLSKEDELMATAQDVLDAVNDETTVEQGVITLLDKINAQLTDVKARLTAAGADPAELDVVISQINTNKAALADAVTRNTPAEA